MFQVPKNEFIELELQPARFLPWEEGISVRKPSSHAYLNGSAKRAAVWGNGIAFDSGLRAGWELVSAAWRTWVLGGSLAFFLAILS